jgi:Ca-activated chloride channel family protein
MKIITRFIRRSVVAQPTPTALYLMVKLCAPAPAKGAARPPLCILPVVDVSGSMENGKMEAVCHALEKLVAHLVPGDVLGLVTFDSTVRTLMAPGEVTCGPASTTERT